MGIYNYNAKRIIECILLACLPLVIWSSKIEFPKNYISLFSIALIFSAGLVSVYLSEYTLKSFAGYWLIISLIFATMIYSTAGLANSNIIKIALAISFAVGIYVYLFYFYLFLDYLNGIFLKDSSNIHAYNGFINRRFLNQVQTWCLPLLILSSIYFDRTNTTSLYRSTLKYLIFFIASSYICIIVITGGRGTAISYLIALTILRIIFGRKFNSIIYKMLLIWIAGIFLYIIITYLIPYCLSIDVSTHHTQSIVRSSDTGRLTLWNIAINLIKENPYFGVGPLMYNGQYNAVIYNHPHNSLLWIGSEMGLIVTSTFMILIAYLLGSYFRCIKLAGATGISSNEKSHIDIIIGYSLSLSILCAIIHSIFSGIYLMPASQLIGLLVVILSISNYQKLHFKLTNQDISYIAVSRSQKYLSGLLLTFVALLSFMYMYDSEFGKIIPDFDWAPGFWMQGAL